MFYFKICSNYHYLLYNNLINNRSVIFNIEMGER